MEGLNWQTLSVPFASGLQQKSDDRARSSAALDIARDVQFDETGGLQTRHPFTAVGTNIFGGGTLANMRRVVEYDGELLVFTDTALYSWNAQLSVWVQKGTHLAVKVDEQSVFVDTGEQRECDRAELNGTIVYAWSEPTGSTYGDQIRVAAIDKATGSVLMAPTTSTDAGGGKMPRLVALATKVLLLYVQVSGANVKFKALDPAAPLAGVVGAGSPVYTSGIGAAHESYDVERIPGADAAIAVVASDATGEGTILMRIPASGTTTTRLVGRLNVGDTVDVLRVAIACTTDGTQALVVREGGGTVEGDVVNTSDLTDGAFINIAIGTSAGSGAAFVTAAHDTASWHVFWAAGLTEGVGDYVTERNTVVSSTGVVGTESTFIHRLCPASRAFRHGAAVYLWLVFGGFVNTSDNVAVQLQSSYFLYRSDGLLVAKAAASRAGGLADGATDPRGGVLPGVQLVAGSTGYAWCGTDRRVFITEPSLGPILGPMRAEYADRGPRDITFTFDSNDARRCVQLGETLYIAGGEVMQYDGQQLAEVGFHMFPWALTPSLNGAGSIPDGDYTYKSTYRWQNARGEIERSTTAQLATITVTAGPKKIAVAAVPLSVTHKTVNPPAAEVWRTAVNPIDDSPFHRVTSNDPSNTTNPNRYLANLSISASQDAFDDDLTDTNLIGREQSDEVAPIVRLAPPPASIIAAGTDRLFLAGISGEPDRVWYSRLRGDGEIASFHGVLTITVPRDGGNITALAFLNETLIVFRETAIYALPGDGYDNAGGGSNFGPARALSRDIGAVNHESVVFTPAGLVFKSAKGWYLLNRGWSLDYIGASVVDHDGETPLAVNVVEYQHQVRVLLNTRMLVWDYLVNQWAEWTVGINNLHACVWSGEHVYLNATGPRKQQSDTYDDLLDYGIDIETAWIKPADLQGFARIRKLQILGQLMSSDLTHLRIRIAYDYKETYVDDKYWPVSPTTTGSPLQLKIGPRRQQVQAIKIRITAIRRYVEEQVIDDVPVMVTVNGAPTGEALKLTGLALEVGVKRNPYPRLGAAQRS